MNVLNSKVRGAMDRLLFSDDYSFEGRRLNALFVVLSCVIGAQSLLWLFVPNSSEEIALGLISIAVIAILFYLNSVRHRYNLCAWLVVVIMGLFALPVTVVVSGGDEGPITLYFLLTIIVIFYLMRGRWLWISLAVLMGVLSVSLLLAGDLLTQNYLLDDVSHLQYLLTLIIVGISVGIISIIDRRINIRERSRRDAAIIERDKALADALVATEAKSAFLSNMSHEIRTPLNAIIGMTAVGRGTGDCERKDYTLERIEEASVHLLGVINDILDMAKIEANKLELAPVNFELTEMLRSIVYVVGFKAEERRQEITFTVDEAIPAIIYADEQRLSQVFVNLLGNAIKFTPEDGRIHVHAYLVENREHEATILFKVTDTGIGINEEQMGRLFKSFEQADNTTARRFGGTGLGLTISKSIVEMMEGQIWAHSKLGEGTTFSFFIKVGCPAEGALDDKQSDDATVSVAGLDGFHLLLAEDLDINAEIVMALLEPTGITLDVARNGVEAVELFKRNPGSYDLILMDMQMPIMDGLEATRRLRALELEAARTVPIVAMTANVFTEDIERCLEAGMNDHLGKPLEYNTLITLLRSYLLGEGRDADTNGPLRSAATTTPRPALRSSSFDMPLAAVYSENNHMEWKTVFETGNETIDSQHRLLYKLAFELLDACAPDGVYSELGASLDYFTTAVGTHFDDEELLMQRSDYPPQVQKEHHGEFMALLHGIKEKYDAEGYSPELTRTISTQVMPWLIEHTRTDDNELAIHIRDHEAVKGANT
jgi:hemerythrin-like metal-binding protein